MSISQKLDIRQSQQLVMTPQLQQAIKLLQLTNLELAEFVEEQLQENPFLERDERANMAERGETAKQEERADADQTVGTETLDTDYSNIDTEAAPGDASAGDWSSVNGARGAMSEDYDAVAQSSAELSLHDHLTEQLSVATDDPQQRLIGAHLIDLVDETGYLREDIDVLQARLGATYDDVMGALTMVQGFDPAGVGARTLEECLRLQLADRGELSALLDSFLNHIHLLGSHDLAGMKRACEIDEEQLRSAIDQIRQLNPKPGLQFGSDHVHVMIPDVHVTEAGDGGWKVELNAETLPKVIANERYFSRLSSGDKAGEKGGEVRTFLNEQMSNANWLVKSLDQRARTILKVSTEIVKYQDDFLLHGVKYLRPLNLRKIADNIEMHESTVSRVTSNKFIHTPRGTFELKYFFTAAISSRAGDATYSAEAIRHRIKDMIEAEDVSNPLSDDTIVRLLAEENIDIARRTVAKYREALSIPSSVQRRRAAKNAF